MKITIIALALLSTSSVFAVNNVKDLAVDCTMQTEITQVSDITFKPGKPQQGRVNAVPPSLTFKAGLKIIQQSPGCDVLKSKYRIYTGDLVVWGSSKDVFAGNSLNLLVGKNYEFKVQQYIGLKNENGYLPLFPFAHAEKLMLTHSSPEYSFSTSLNFDLNWVYSIKKIEDMSDIEKLSLAEKTKFFVFTDEDFLQLFLQLEPVNASLKKAFAYLIWGAFKQNANYQVLKFHVGGPGSYYGEPMAKKLNVISHLPNTFSSLEIVQLLTEFPTWVLAGYSGTQCLNFSGSDLEQALQNINAKAPVLTSSEKYMLQDPLSQIVSEGFISDCTKGKVSANSKELAQNILLQL